MGGGAEMMLDDAQEQALIIAAFAAAEQAYAPYSDYPVGAALLFDDGAVITGCNVENASYGLALCAETVAVAKAMGEGRRGGLVAVAVVGGGPAGLRAALTAAKRGRSAPSTMTLPKNIACGRSQQPLWEAWIAGRGSAPVTPAG